MKTGVHVVVGGCGFTGTHLIRRLLAREAPVIAIDTADLPVEFSGRVVHHRIDIRDASALESIPLPEDAIIYHLAARQFHGDVPRFDQDDWFADVNVRGTRTVLEWMSGISRPRLVYLSTDMVYGFPETVPVTPTHPKRPLGPYGRSKLAAESLCEQARERDYRITILRPRMIVGPGRFGILTKLFRLMGTGLPVPTIGSGMNRYQMISVEDVVDAIIACTERGFPQLALNLGSGDAPPVKQLLKNTIRRIGSRSPVIPIPAPPLKWLLAALEGTGMRVLHREQYQIADLNYVVDIAQSLEALGWTPSRNDEDMLVDAYAYYRDCKNTRLPAPTA